MSNFKHKMRMGEFKKKLRFSIGKNKTRSFQLRIKNRRIKRLEIKVDKLQVATKKCFPHPLVCDGTLLVNMDNYNELVKIFNDT